MSYWKPAYSVNLKAPTQFVDHWVRWSNSVLETAFYAKREQKKCKERAHMKSLLQMNLQAIKV